MDVYQTTSFVSFEGTFLGRISENESKRQTQQYEETVVVSISDIYRIDLRHSKVLLKTPFSLEVYKVSKPTAKKLVEELCPIEINPSTKD